MATPGGLIRQGEVLAILDEETGEALAIPPRAVVAAFERYARPLAAAPPPPSTDALEIALENGSSARVRAFRFRGWGDVEPSDYLLLEREGAEPVAGPAPLLVAALRHLARAARPT